MTGSKQWVDLAAERFGGKALQANDEFFAPKENLLRPGRGVFLEDKYTERGKWMDGWETRRRRVPGHDWCVVRLGLPGQVHAVTVDTNHFRGNHPEACSLEVIAVDGTPTVEDVVEAVGWRELLPRRALGGHAENQFPISDPGRYTHVRLNIFPDGGVARLRVLGVVLPRWDQIGHQVVDLVGIQHGGLPIAASDQFFSEPLNLLGLGRSDSMGDGWETRRRRGPGHDWVILRLGHRGAIEEVEVDTAHFKGNYPESCCLEGYDGGENGNDPSGDNGDGLWFPLLPRTPLEPDRPHIFPPCDICPVTHVRFNIFPDGGVSRLRLRGRVV